jgi:hypothetical protein
MLGHQYRYNWRAANQLREQVSSTHITDDAITDSAES